MGVKVSGEEGYQVLIGGGADKDQGLARELLPAIRFTDLPAKMESLFTVYTQHRDPEESFLNFTRRHQIAELQSFCSPQDNAYSCSRAPTSPTMRPSPPNSAVRST